ncbi:hypothetical protein ACIBKY_51195 [Nonomuraea sp. NPDC050394]|uniref:hypothetical protein n=1 Tax=Nonomuraea sp. NPDC050394 TaxID=3364363 RepID=UPI0037875ECA
MKLSLPVLVALFWVSLFLIAVVACAPSSPPHMPSTPAAAVVVGRAYEPSEYKTKSACVTRGTGAKKKRVCVPVKTWEAEEWTLIVRTGGVDREIDVSRDVYDACPDGASHPECAGGTP